MSEIVKNSSTGIKKSTAIETPPVPNQIIDIHPEHLPLAENRIPASTKSSRHWKIIRQNMSEIVKNSSTGIKKSSAIVPVPNQIIDIHPEYLPLAEFVNLVIQVTASQEHDVPKIVLKPKKPKKQVDLYDEAADIRAMIHLFLGLVAAIVLLLSFVGCIVLWNVLKHGEPINCIDDVVGDGVCDDRQNIPECNYDDGDCCLIPRIMKFCEDCECYLGKC
jgi:hypothetical protein